MTGIMVQNPIMVRFRSEGINKFRKIYPFNGNKKVSRAFKDISFSFDPHPVTKDLPVLLNERAIVRSVRNLIETIPTERFFNSNLGSDVRKSLFEFVDFGTAAIIEDQIVDVIDAYEPKIDKIW